jgi:two-component system CheB/CheR fusion protein
VIDRQVQQLARLVDDLLDVSRITRGKVTLRMERIELGAAIDRAIETARPVIEAAHHELIVEVPDVPIPVTADLVRLSQIISNLLHNAAKYTKSGGRIRLVVQIAPSNAEVSIRVQDSGIGIAREQLCKVFEPFAQVDSSISRSQGGLGIGLTIVKRLTELHGGGVSVHSEGVGRGSEFVVRLPLPKEDCRDESAAAANKAAHAFALLPISPVQSADAAPRVLVVDDNIDSADTLQVMLRAAGYEAETAYSGESALHAALANPPQVVLLDLGMPGMSGLEVARCLRENQRTQGAVLIAMTGWGQAEDRRRTQEAGFDHHLVKPIDIAALSALLQARSHQPRRG